MGSGISGCRYRTHSNAAVVLVNPRRESNHAISVEFPEYWVHNQASNEHFHKVIECPEDKLQLQDLLDGTMASVTGEKLPRLCIEKVVRLEDSEMWSTYEGSVCCLSEAREQEELPVTEVRTPWGGSLQESPLTWKAMSRDMKQRLRLECNEAYLWHGTDRKSAENIIGHHFDIKRAGKANAKALGRGAYFAEAASLSDKYSKPGPDGLHVILLVRAALGRVYVANRGYTKWRGGKLKRLVSTTKLVGKGEYDSVLGDRKFAFNMDVREYVLANNTQLYPEYMILYSRQEENQQLVSEARSSASSSSQAS